MKLSNCDLVTCINLISFHNIIYHNIFVLSRMMKSSVVLLVLFVLTIVQSERLYYEPRMIKVIPDRKPQLTVQFPEKKPDFCNNLDCPEFTVVEKTKVSTCKCKICIKWDHSYYYIMVLAKYHQSITCLWVIFMVFLRNKKN